MFRIRKRIARGARSASTIVAGGSSERGGLAAAYMERTKTVNHEAAGPESDNRDARTIVILTALNLEYQAVRTHMADLRTQVHPAGTRFECGTLPGRSGRIALAVIGEGNQSAAVQAERAIALFAPASLLCVGIAGALRHDIRLGDIVVATRIYGYHSGREQPDGFLACPRSWEVAHGLCQVARHVDVTQSWRALLAGVPNGAAPQVHFAAIAAGEVVLNSRRSPMARRLNRFYSDAAAIETESAGVAQAGHLNSATPIMIIRGISDSANGDKEANDRAGWQIRAATHAAAFAVALVAALGE
jgi:8-oxo-dGTP diphosphatase